MIEQGMTWDEYLGGIQKDQHLFKPKYEEVEISPGDSALVEGVRRHVYVLALGEDRCPDVYNNAAFNPHIQLRVFPRDQHHDLRHRDLIRGQSQSMPAFGCIDENVQEFARHTGGRPKLLWDGIGSIG